MIKMVTDKKSGLEKPDFFNSKTILNLLYFSILRRVSCFRPYKYTNFKAIHNMLISNIFFYKVVFDPTNIQILKQFTTWFFLVGRVKQQVQYYEINLKNSFFGVEKFNFSLGLRLILY